MSSMLTGRNKRTPTRNFSLAVKDTLVFCAWSTRRKGGSDSCTVQGPLSGKAWKGALNDPHGNSSILLGTILSGTCLSAKQNLGQFGFARGRCRVLQTSHTARFLHQAFVLHCMHCAGQVRFERQRRCRQNHRDKSVTADTAVDNTVYATGNPK